MILIVFKYRNFTRQLRHCQEVHREDDGAVH